MGLRQQASTAAITLGRALFADTPVQRWPVTTRLYRAMFRFGHSGHEVVVPFRGLRLTAPNRDVTIVPGLVGGFYETIELDIFEQLAARSRTIIDVGANIGLYSCLAAQHGPTGSRVVAFEPVPDNVAYLRRNLAENGHGVRVRVEAVAVGDRSGDVTIYQVEGDVSIGTHSVSARNASDSATSLRVPMACLDEYVAHHGITDVDVVKVDVEGFEAAVLAGAARLLRAQRPTLLIEYIAEHLRNCQADPEEVVRTIFSTYDAVYAIDELGRSVVRCAPEDLLHPRPGVRVGANLVAVHGGTRPDHQQVVESAAAVAGSPRPGPAARAGGRGPVTGGGR
ncbi:MAG TPA: FkbM family methyltransferase [Kineosporiaceae bacterium]